MSAPICSRRVSAGLTPPPGSLARLPVWWGRVDWLEVEVRGALRENLDLCAAHHVAADTVYAVARAHAGFADSRTGRDCRPTNERLIEAAGCSLSTIKRARRVLKALGLLVEVTAGRSVMTVAERLAAWERGSSHRQIAAEFVLCSRRDRSRRPQPDLQVVDDGPPPVGQIVRTKATEISGSLRSKDGTRRAAARPAHTEKGSRGGPRPVDVRARRLAEQVRSRLGWLSGVPTSRMVPTLHRFAVAGWTARDVDTAVRNALAARGWRLPAQLRQPAAYLALLLREVDPADRPGAQEEFMEEMERRERAYERLRIWGPPCPHGEPAGNVPSPTRGTIPCPFCRGVPDELVLGEDMRPNRRTPGLASSAPEVTSAEVADPGGR